MIRTLSAAAWTLLLTASLLPGAGRLLADELGAVPRRLDLATSLEVAALENPSVLVARTRIREARAGVKAARADRIPDIDLVDVHRKTNRAFPSFFSQPDYTHQVQATLQQRVFSGGAIPAGVRLARALEDEAEAGYHLALEQVLERVTGAYLGVLEEDETRMVVEESISTQKRRIQDIQAKVDAGLMLETDRLQADLQLLEDERALLVSRTQEQLSRDTLEVLLGLPEEAGLELTGVLAPLEGMDPSAVCRDVSLEGSPTLGLQRARTEQAEARLALARAAFRPSVDVQVSQYHIANGLSVFSSDPDYMEAVGVLTVPVFDGGRRRGQTQQAERLLEAARLDERSQRDELTIQVGQAVLGIEEAQARLRSSETRIRLAVRNREIVQDRYLQGAAIQSELLDADVAHRRARLDGIKSRFDILRGVVRVLGLTGRMTGTSLAGRDLSADRLLAARVRGLEDGER